MPCAARGRGRACKLAPCGRSDRQALTSPRARCAARRLRRHPTASPDRPLARRRSESARGRRRGAGRQRGRAGRVSEPVARRRRDRASFAPGPLTPCSARAAEAQRRSASRGRLSLVTFFGEAKKVTRPPGEIRLGRRTTKNRPRSATHATRASAGQWRSSAATRQRRSILSRSAEHRQERTGTEETDARAARFRVSYKNTEALHGNLHRAG